MRALLSIHDVMPSSRAAVSAMLAQLFVSVPLLRPCDITLLVVPGQDWSDDDLAWLRRMVVNGHPLAGHGWCHQAGSRRSLFHRLHSAVLSHDAAEHLSKPEHELVALVLRCHAWFAHHQLPVGPLYVPPAWAAGSISGQALKSLPFTLMETLSGVRDVRYGKQLALPLAGYEADNEWRARLLSVSNRLNCRWAKSGGRIMRIGLHPFDLEYLLADHIVGDLNRVKQFCDYSSLFSASTDAEVLPLSR